MEREHSLLCYTFYIMTNSPRDYWSRWAQALRRYQLNEFAAALLEAVSPLAVIGAQALYAGSGLIASDQLAALAQTLEEEKEVRALASFLRAKKAAE